MLDLHKLQTRKNRDRLKELIIFYGLEQDTISLARPLGLEESNEPDADSTSVSATLDSVIESYSRGALVILGSHLGVDCDTLHERVIQTEFQLSKGIAGKRDEYEEAAYPEAKKPLFALPSLKGSTSSSEPNGSKHKARPRGAMSPESSDRNTKRYWEGNPERWEAKIELAPRLSLPERSEQAESPKLKQKEDIVPAPQKSPQPKQDYITVPTQKL
ncbi:hypothetical protein FQN57_005759 [Myotisia sp. PD_48]|nr:hypothetical protein FQN57_005759 [Myotisia sp. PD_48]